MLTLTSSNKNSLSFSLLDAENNRAASSLISDNSSLISIVDNNGGYDTCSFLSEPSNTAIMAFGETSGSIAFNGEWASSITYSGSETCGSIASSSISFSSSSSSSSSFSCCC